MSRLQQDVERLRHDVEGALRRALDPADVLPMLHRLVRTAPADSDESVFAHRQLAELIAPRHPWRAALYARRVVALRPADDRGWAILAFAQTLLENYRFAATAYAHALTCAPSNPWYAHNLGHLLDVALDRPAEALPWLASAFAAARDHVEVATSYAHALARAGDLPLAKRVLTRAMRSTGTGPTREQAALWRWIERGAPEPQRDASGSSPRSFLPSVVPVEVADAREGDERDERHERGGATRRRRGERAPSPLGDRIRDRAGGGAPATSVASDPATTTPAPRAPAGGDARTASTTATTATTAITSGRSARSATRRARRPGAVGTRSAVEEVLARQVVHLPFDAGQRARARSFAREVSGRMAVSDSKPEALAAAVAYSIVAEDEIPLTQAEVAATFRVRVSALRARYHQLRSALSRVDLVALSPLSSEAGPSSESGTSSAAGAPLRATRTGRPSGLPKAKK